MKLRIRDIREDNDKTQKELAKELDCTQQTYSRYEKEEITIDIFRLIQLAKYYNTSIDYLVGLTDEQKPYPRTKKTKE
jgi:transcriptional regulator with XRE-family HTH domain